MKKSIRIGGACGFWGEASDATDQLCSQPSVDFLIYDYLAEVTLSIMSRARKKDSTLGYATDFVSDAMAPNIENIAELGIKIISNAGGMNPYSCASALRDLLTKKQLEMKIAVVTGDDILSSVDKYKNVTEMFSENSLPEIDTIQSMNAYLGAGPIVKALDEGADIVITGRCVDSALTLAACIHSFGWSFENYDLIAAGSLAGHLLECGPQATGGNFTDWHKISHIKNIGYPIAEVYPSGEFNISKPDNSDGLVSVHTVSEQLLYEIDNPSSYILPDVICDFTDVRIQEKSSGVVSVKNVKGRAPTGKLKVSTTYSDGFKTGFVANINGSRAKEKAKFLAEEVIARTQQKLSSLSISSFSNINIETYGGRPNANSSYEEIVLTLSVKHENRAAVNLLIKEMIGAALAAPPGLHIFMGGGMPKPMPVIALFSFLVEQNDIEVNISIDERHVEFSHQQAVMNITHPDPIKVDEVSDNNYEMVTLPLEAVALARSGDKGDSANIGVIARKPELFPWIWKSLTPSKIKACFATQSNGDVHRYALPGIYAMNIVMEETLGGGGVASLRVDSQGKGFAQRLLSTSVSIPKQYMNFL